MYMQPHMTQIEEFKEGLQYSEEVRNAVRYGYMYRKEAENRIVQGEIWVLGALAHWGYLEE